MNTLRSLIAPAIFATLMLTSQVEAGVNYDSLVVTNQGARNYGYTISWKATVANPFSDTAYFQISLKCVDADGFIVVDHDETYLKLGPKVTKNFSDTFEVTPEEFPLIRSITITIEEDVVTTGLKKLMEK